LGTLFFKWGLEDSESIDDDGRVAEISFSIDEKEHIYIHCFYKEDDESRTTFAKLYTHINCGSLSSEILEIIHHQYQEEENLEEYLKLLANISEYHNDHMLESNSHTSPDPLVKPTQVIDGQEGGDLF
jgi:hypothetical protein|tara:strand:- start:3669 stop:4052 length:384 start_codon:yes stop_codon:yes gene_type:complete